MVCVIAKLDKAATERLSAVRCVGLPAGEGARPLYGHITLATYVGQDESAFCRICRELLAGMPPFSVRYEKLRVLAETSIIVAVPGRSAELERLHARIAARFPEGLDAWTRAGAWYPHTTLFFGPGAELQDLCGQMAAAFVPFRAAVCRIELSQVLEDGYRILDRIPLTPR